MIFEFVRFLGRPVWTAAQLTLTGSWPSSARIGPGPADGAAQGVDAGPVLRLPVARYQGDIHALTGHVVVSRSTSSTGPPRRLRALRVPPADAEVEVLFGAWRDWLPDVRKFLPAARDYLAASLWRRIGLRINETLMLDIRDWRPDLGEHGKLHVRFGKGSRGRGPKTRLVPAINAVDTLWTGGWPRCATSSAMTGPTRTRRCCPANATTPHRRCSRVGDRGAAGRSGRCGDRWLPAWSGRLTPHGLRHYCASSLYARGMDLKAIQELLGHEWLSTTTRYIHVHADHIEQAWATANDRIDRPARSEREVSRCDGTCG